MPRNGSGTYAAPANSFNPAVTGNTASPTDWNATLADISSALTASIAKDGQTVITANLPMAGYRHTNVGAAVNRTDYVRYDQLQDSTVNWVDGGGTADAITATYSPAITTVIDGQLFFVRATAANTTTTPTFSPNGLTARTIVKTGGSALIAGDIAGDGHELILRYDLTNTRYELLNPSDADAARKSVNNTFTGTNTFAGTLNIPDGTVSTYAKIASGVFASSADIIAGTASKLVDAATINAAGLIKMTDPVSVGTGTTKDFAIPTGAKRVTLHLFGVSYNATDTPMIQLGGSGGVETSGYTGSITTLATSTLASAGTGTNGMAFANTGQVASTAFSGDIVIEKISSSNQYSIRGHLSTGGSAQYLFQGHKTTTGELQTVRLTSSAASNFDAGVVGFSVEY